MAKKKIVIIDTSVILYDKNSMESFPGCEVFLPLVVLDELDRFKDKPGFLGENARYVNRFLDSLRGLGRLHEGVYLDNGQSIKVSVISPNIASAPTNTLDWHLPDNKILLQAIELSKAEPEAQLAVVTKDINLRVKCDAHGIKAEDYYRDYIDLPVEPYEGMAFIDDFSDKDIDTLYHQGTLCRECCEAANTFVIAKSNSSSALTRWNEELGQLELLSDKHFREISIKPKNKEQRFALWALLNPDISLVTITGLAGSGKTYLTLLSAIAQVEQGKYDRVVFTRNITPVGKEIGFLPGDINEKMAPWMSPFVDTLRDRFKDPTKFEMLRVNGKFEIAPLSFIRGRTFTRSIVVVDESQNATIHELKTIITRVGEDSKIVLMGDTDQIDTPYINRDTNGLAIVAKKMKESQLTAHIHLPTGIRSELATEASEML